MEVFTWQRWWILSIRHKRDLQNMLLCFKKYSWKETKGTPTYVILSAGLVLQHLAHINHSDIYKDQIKCKLNLKWRDFSSFKKHIHLHPLLSHQYWTEIRNVSTTNFCDLFCSVFASFKSDFIQVHEPQ